MVGPIWEGWLDASCFVELACLCERIGGDESKTSDAYKVFREELLVTEQQSYDICSADDDEETEYDEEKADKVEEGKEDAILRELHAILFFVLATFILALTSCVLATKAATEGKRSQLLYRRTVEESKGGYLSPDIAQHF